MPTLRRVDAVICRLTEYFVLGVGVSFTVFIVLQVVSRFVFNLSLYFIDALSGYLFVWFVFLGSSLALRYDMHVSIDLVARLPPRIFKIIFLIGGIMAYGFIFLILWASVPAISDSLRNLDPSLGVSTFWSVIAIPIGFVLMAYHYTVVCAEKLLASQLRTLGPLVDFGADIKLREE